VFRLLCFPLYFAALPLVAQGIPFFSPEVLRARISNTENSRTADINGDGLPDLIYSIDGQQGKIEYQLNRGGDIFDLPQVIEPQFFSISTLETADLTGNGRPGIAAGTTSDSLGVRVYLHNGTGFTESQRFPGFNTVAVRFADMDGDGDLDLVYQTSSANFTVHALKWRPNNGSGIFGDERNISSVLARRMIIADVDGDGDLDVIAMQANANNIVWYPNSGIGNFGAARTIEGNRTSLLEMTTGDIDADGDIDLLVMAAGQVYQYTNNRTGTFTRTTLFSNFGSQEQIYLIKGDADAFPDVMYKANSSFFYRRNVRGTFAAEQLFPGSNNGWNIDDLTIVDYDKDGRDDFISTGFGDRIIRLHRNGTSLPPRIQSFAASSNTVAAGASATLNWNVEGATSIRIDGALVSGTSRVVSPGDSERTYTLTATNSRGTVSAITTVFVPAKVFAEEATLVSDTANINDFDAGDINGNGRKDIVVVSSNNNTVGLFRSTGPNTFAPRQTLFTLTNPVGVLLIDVDKDGDLDLIVSYRNGANLYRNNGSGGFSAATALSSDRTYRAKAADMNGDGWSDLILFDNEFSPIRLLMNNGLGGFLPQILVSPATGVQDVTPGDVTGDGLLDLIVVSNTVGFHRATSHTSFLPREAAVPEPILEPILNARGPLFFTDMNGDGIGDIVVRGGLGTGASTHNVCVQFGRGNGFFQRAIAVSPIPNASFITLGDFDGDLDLDVGYVTPSNGSPRTAGWLEGEGTGRFSAAITATPGPVNSFQIKAIDLDSDGDLDLLATSSNRLFWMRNVTEHATPPSIDTFASTYPVLHRGESVELTWSVTGDTTVSISPGIGTVTGGKTTVTPSETTTYILTATNRGGTVTSEITVTVVDRPVIHTFTSDKNNVDRTTPVTLSWKVAGATSLSISPGIGSVTGTSIIRPIYETTTFTLTATNAEGSDSLDLTVAVDPSLFRFAAGIPGPTGMSAPQIYQLADFNLDGLPDIVAASKSDSGTSQGMIYWLRGNVNGTFGPQRIIQNNNFSGANALTVGDFNNDGRPDVAIVTGTIPGDPETSKVLWFNFRPLGFWTETTIESGLSTFTSLHSVDWDGDGRADLIATSIADGRVFWFRNLGDGNFAPRAQLGPAFGEVTSISTADINGDLAPDLIIARNTTQADLLVLPNLGDGTTGEARPLINRGSVRYFDFGDLDGDGDLDLVVTSLDPVRCERFLNDGNGNFGDPLRLIPTDQIGSGIRLADVDGDGDLDVVWLNGIFTWSENLGDGTFRNEPPSVDLKRAIHGTALLGDFDGDGDLDAIGRSGDTQFHFDWFENLSTPPSAAPVIEAFDASALVILPGQPLRLNWAISGFPKSVTLSPAGQSLPQALTQREFLTRSSETTTQTVQSFTLTATNAHGTTNMPLEIQVGNPPDIRSFTHFPALVNQGDAVELAWEIERADALKLDDGRSLTGLTGISLIPGLAPFTTYGITATNIFGESTASTEVEVNRPPVATPLATFTATPAGAPFQIPTVQAFADPDAGDFLTWSLTGNTLPGLFTEIGIDAATGALTGAFTPYIDGESLITVRATDRNALFAETSVLIALPRVPDPELALVSALVLNRQTGLFEQTLTITNTGGRDIGGFRVEITGLPPGVSLRDAGATAAGEAHTLTHHAPLAAGASLEIRLEYFSALRGTTLFSPSITLVQLPIPGAIPRPDGVMFQIDRMLPLPGGAFLIEWPAIPSRRYRVEYADTPDLWLASPVIITAAANRQQWIDQGPPKTLTHPSILGRRLYRVVELSQN